MRLLIAAILVTAAALAGCAGGGGDGTNQGAGDAPTPTTVTNVVTGSPISAPNPFGKPANATPTPASPTPTSPTPASPTPTSPTPDAGSGEAPETHAVSVVDFAFQPRELTIAVGDAVTWTHAGEAPHTVTAEDGTFDSGTLAEGDTFSHAFDEPGTYAYVCRIHPSSMTGTITVA